MITTSHDLMRYVIEHNRSAVAIHDKDLRYMYVSQKYLDSYRVKEPEIIGKEKLDVIFDGFVQGDITYTKHYAGSGLGLAISRDLTTLLNGRLSVQSEIGVGSTFQLVLPLHDNDDVSLYP